MSNSCPRCRHRYCSLRLLLGLLVGLSVLPAVAQTDSRRDPPAEPTRPRDREVDREIEAIEGLRRQLGSVRERLEGLFDDDRYDRELDQAVRERYQQLADQQGKPRPQEWSRTDADPGAGRARVPNTSRDASPRWDRGPEPPRRGGRLDSPPGPDPFSGRFSAGPKPRPMVVQPPVSPPQQELLRHAARRLEELAAELENAGLYRQADRLRQDAASCWQEARQVRRPDQPDSDRRRGEDPFRPSPNRD